MSIHIYFCHNYSPKTDNLLTQNIIWDKHEGFGTYEKAKHTKISSQLTSYADGVEYLYLKEDEEWYKQSKIAFVSTFNHVLAFSICKKQLQEDLGIRLFDAFLCLETDVCT